MELKEKDMVLVEDILGLGSRHNFSMQINPVDGSIAAVIDTYHHGPGFNPEMGLNVIRLYNYRYNFYYEEYRNLTDDGKKIVDLAVSVIEIINRKSKIDIGVIYDNTAEELEDDSTQYIKDNFFKDYTDDLAKTLHDKNTDYGDSFSKGMKRYGMKYVSSRLFDKLNRIDELSGSGDQLVKGESLKDSVKDLAGYAVLLWKYLDESEED